mgnify:CR=1 FL=1
MTRTTALLIGENSVHLFDEKAPLIEAAFGDDVDVHRTTDMAALEDLSAYDVVIDYVTDNSLTDAQIEGLVGFVRDGGGYLPVHPAADLTSYIDEDGEFGGRDEPVPAMRELVGGHFVDHPEQSTFGVDIIADHPVTEGVSDFEVFDEPYQVDCDEGRVTVLARMDHPDLDEAYPVVWVREAGAGRVCYNSLGHTDEALEHESNRRLLRNALAWVTS